MNIKENFKKSYIGVQSYKRIREILTLISPTLNTKLTYRIAKGKDINLKNPQTLAEKISWLKLNVYNDNELVTNCADKYSVRNYVKKCGYEHLLIELINAWDSVDEIDWVSLPNKFVLKCNHGSGYNIICKDKSKFDIEGAKFTLNKWMKEDYWKSYAELNYKGMHKKITCEKFIETDQGNLPNDYKFYCFNGEVKAILVIMNRGNDTKGVFMSPEWTLLSKVDKYTELEKVPEKPKSLNMMLKSAIDLSKPFPFVRVDYYQSKHKAIFGELTFTPAGGLYVSETMIDGKTMGELLIL